jgi:threonine/homoserine/homoserine lactone efflux protein
MGAIFLIFLSYKMVLYNPTKKKTNQDLLPSQKMTSNFLMGLTISIVNPKILIFFTSVFSQFINNDFNDYNKLGVGLLAGIIDTVWYILVSYSVNLPNLKNYIISNQRIIFLFFGIILIIYSIYLVNNSIRYFI